MKDILYLGSKSSSRRKLLSESLIPYKTLDHESDECGVEIKHGFSNYVLGIAKSKMEHLILPEPKMKSDYIFVLTADTLVRSIKSDQILCKPIDITDAKRMLTVLREEPIEVVTACCLEKKLYKDEHWHVELANHWVSSSICEFYIPEEDVDLYLEKTPAAMHGCSAAIVEGFGQRYFKSINGSYSSVVGLPLYELLVALKDMGFKL